MEAQHNKVIFFLYPPKLIQEELINVIVHLEFETYFIDDHVKILPVLEEYTDSILFINIDHSIENHDWEKYVEKLVENPALSELIICVLTYHDDKNLKNNYLMYLMEEERLITLRQGQGAIESTKPILRIINKNRKNDRRKFIRSLCGNNAATFNAVYGDKNISGDIRNISSAGMVMVFQEDIEVAPNTRFEDVLLRLKGILCKVNGTVVGFRVVEGHKKYILMFHDSVTDDIKDKIRHFVFQCLQEKMEEKLANL
ncbi:MAG: hypothetical protein MJB14_12740 [Spirochaetes bacterium]|nr:hypothetical protein [Spirochaetota bacterium]